MFGYHLWQHFVQNGNADFDSLMAEILAQQQDAYVSFWDSLTTRQQNFLSCLAKGEKAALMQAAVILRWGLGSAATVAKVSRKLEEHGFIAQRGRAGPGISDPFFGEWIRTL